MEPPVFGPSKEPGQSKPNMPMRGMALWLLLLALFLTVFQMFAQVQEKPTKVPYSPDFVQLVDQGKIRRCELVMEVSGLQYVRGELVDLDPRTGKSKKFRVDVPVTDDLTKMLREKGVQFEFKSQNPYIWQVVSGAIPFLIVLGLLYFLFVRQMRIAGKGALSFGKKSRAPHDARPEQDHLRRRGRDRRGQRGSPGNH